MNVFVTGGSRGIGKAIVLKFIKEGFNCAFTYVTHNQAAEKVIAEAQEINPQAYIKAYQLDLKSAKDIEACSEQVLSDFKSIEVVVNNAAIVKNNAAVLMSDEEWEEVIATNLSGPFYVIRSFLMHMLANRFGRIINISSLAQDGCSGQANYAASKAGLLGLSKTIAREYGAKGITTNVVTVGYVQTQMTEEHLADKLHEIWLQYCPMKRIGTAEEIASLVHYLTTPEAGFINGEVIHVAGGLTYVP